MDAHDPERSRAHDPLTRAEDALMRGRLSRRDFMRVAAAAGLSAATAGAFADAADSATQNQARNTRALKSHYDYVIVGAGSAGCVIASRLTENPAVSVLLIEAGGTNDDKSVEEPALWPTNIGTPRSYVYEYAHAEHCNDRTIPLTMGRGIGGGSAINVMVWARGHKANYDEWAEVTGDPAWNYDSVLSIYRRIEDWQGEASPWRGKGGYVYVDRLNDPNPIAPAMVAASAKLGIASTDDLNGKTMESDGGCGIAQALIKEGRRHTVAAAYLYRALPRPNLTVLTDTTVTRLGLSGDRASAVHFIQGSQARSVSANKDIILSAGSVGTPKLLMLSGIGDAAELKALGIQARIHSPNVGRNLRDHILLGGCVWEYKEAIPPRNNLAECTLFWKSDASLKVPDLQPFQIEVPFVTDTAGKRFAVPKDAWTLAPGLVQPKSRGRVTLVSSDYRQMARVDPNYLGEPEDMTALVRCVELCREIGNSREMSDFVKREVMPGALSGPDVKNFIRDTTGTYFHLVGSCAMGRDASSVTDSQLRVRGVRGLRIADASVMPNITTGNTMAPSVVIGERLVEILASA